MEIRLSLVLLGPVALTPFLVVGYRSLSPKSAAETVENWPFWAAICMAVAGLAGGAVALQHAGWRADLGSTLWLSALSGTAMYFAAAFFQPGARRLAILAAPYLMGLSALSVALIGGDHAVSAAAANQIWLWVHIVTALATYGAVTVGALAGVGALIKESALKTKRPSGMARALPSVADGERLQIIMLRVAALVLGAGLATGMAAQFTTDRSLVDLDHKTLFSLAAFAVVLGLLFVHHRTGLRGRRIARVGLLAFLLLTLAYPGVKFVTEVILN